jgi:hypothetical protein
MGVTVEQFRTVRYFAIGLAWAMSIAVCIPISQATPLPDDADGQYVGANSCRKCHETAWSTWVQTDHARTGLVFGMAVGREMKARAEARFRQAGTMLLCEECHQPAVRSESASVTADYHAEDGVQCETCHGPGGDHLRVEASKDTLNGHLISTPKMLKDHCQACHFDEKPFHSSEVLGTPAFDAEKFWLRIEHPTPREERVNR